MRTTILAASAALVSVAGSAAADTPPAADPPAASSLQRTDGADDGGAARLPEGFAIGLEAGDPSSVSAAFAALGGHVAVAAAVGTGTRNGIGLQVHGDVIATPLVLHRSGRTVVPLHVGVGVRWWRHDYEPMTIDEIDDEHLGIRGSLAVGVVLPSPRLEVYLEGAPGYDLSRTESCSLISGVDSLCPHAQSGRAFLNVLLGARWFIGG